MDGEFAYATIDQMLVPQRGRGDHDVYQVAAPMLIRRRDVGHLTSQKRAASSSEDLCPPLLKRSYQLAPVVDGPHVHTPNFCCPICDKKVTRGVFVVGVNYSKRKLITFNFRCFKRNHRTLLFDYQHVIHVHERKSLCWMNKTVNVLQYELMHNYFLYF